MQHTQARAFNAENTCVRRNYWLGVPATALGAVAGVTLIKRQPELASVLMFVASLLTGLMTFLNPITCGDASCRCWIISGTSERCAIFFREIELIQTDRIEKP